MNNYTTIKRIILKLLFLFRKKVTAQVVTLAPNELLAGKTALITGCTSGIGLAIAKAFLNAGGSVVATGRDKEKLYKSVKELRALATNNAQVYSYILDVMDVDKLEKAVTEIVDMLPNHRIEILVNNAGLISQTSLPPTDEYDVIMNTNLKSVYFLSKYMARHMIANKIAGNILNIASSSSLRPAGNVYGLSKWGIRGLTEGLAKMLIPHNIVVNAIGPGITATPLMGRMNNKDLASCRNPAGRFSTPEEIANIAVVLTSGMGRMIVGDIVYVSGGAGVITCDDIDYDFN